MDEIPYSWGPHHALGTRDTEPEPDGRVCLYTQDASKVLMTLEDSLVIEIKVLAMLGLSTEASPELDEETIPGYDILSLW